MQQHFTYVTLYVTSCPPVDMVQVASKSNKHRRSTCQLPSQRKASVELRTPNDYRATTLVKVGRTQTVTAVLQATRLYVFPAIATFQLCRRIAKRFVKRKAFKRLQLGDVAIEKKRVVACLSLGQYCQTIILCYGSSKTGLDESAHSLLGPTNVPSTDLMDQNVQTKDTRYRPVPRNLFLCTVCPDGDASKAGHRFSPRLLD